MNASSALFSRVAVVGFKFQSILRGVCGWKRPLTYYTHHSTYNILLYYRLDDGQFLDGANNFSSYFRGMNLYMT